MSQEPNGRVSYQTYNMICVYNGNKPENPNTIYKNDSCNEAAMKCFAELARLPISLVREVNEKHTGGYIKWDSSYPVIILETRWDNRKIENDACKAHTFLYIEKCMFHSCNYKPMGYEKPISFEWKGEPCSSKELDRLLQSPANGITFEDEKKIGELLKTILMPHNIIVDVDNFIVTKVNRTSLNIFPTLNVDELYVIGS